MKQSRYSRSTIVAFTLGACLLSSMAGCYQHVVHANGVGTEGVQVYEPNLKTPADEPKSKPTVVPSKTVPTQKAPG